MSTRSLPQFLKNLSFTTKILQTYRHYKYGPEKLDHYDEIEAWLQKHKISNYVISKDLTVDVMGSVDLSYQQLVVLPFPFRAISGDFDISHNQLTSLQNAPEIVDGHFNCAHNQLKNIEGCPHSVGLTCKVDYNPLDNFSTPEGLPALLGYNLEFYSNITIASNGSAAYAPKVAGGSIGGIGSIGSALSRKNYHSNSEPPSVSQQLAHIKELRERFKNQENSKQQKEVNQTPHNNNKTYNDTDIKGSTTNINTNTNTNNTDGPNPLYSPPNKTSEASPPGVSVQHFSASGIAAPSIDTDTQSNRPRP